MTLQKARSCPMAERYSKHQTTQQRHGLEVDRRFRQHPTTAFEPKVPATVRSVYTLLGHRKSRRR